MASLRRLARMCRDLAKQHVDDPDVPAAPVMSDGSYGPGVRQEGNEWESADRDCSASK